MTDPTRFSLRGTRIWRDPPGRFEPATITIANGAITAVLPFDAAQPDAIDLGDLFVMPGLINTHVHLEFSASSRPLGEYEVETPEERLLRAAGNAHRMLMSGVTTVRDCGSGWSMLALARRPDLSPVRLPRLVCAGPPITVPGGHLHMMGGEVRDMTQMRAHVARAHREGARTVKAMASGGGMTPGTMPERATFSLGELREMVAEAQALAVPTAAHVLATESIRRAALAGFDSLEHCAFFERNAADALVRVFAEDVGRVVADSGAVLMANLSTATRSLDAMRAAGAPDEVGRHALEQFDVMLNTFRKLVALGVPVVCGTDAGVRDTPFEDTWRELDWMTRAGLPAIEAIRAATTRAAGAIGLAGVVGRIAVGHAADLIATNDNPLDDPRVLGDVAMIVTTGEILRMPTRSTP